MRRRRHLLPAIARAGRLAAAWALALAACGKSPLATGAPDQPACNSCHGSEDNAAPPRPAALDKTLGTGSVHVGAHQLHVRDGLAHRAIGCAECHPVPKTVDAPGHVEPGPAKIAWGPLASARGTAPAWDHAAETCSNTYCHGATLPGGTRRTPRWTFDAPPPWTVEQGDETCRGCHGFPPPAPHPQDRACGRCHSGTVDAQGRIRLEGGLHLDGKVELDTSACNICHGGADNPAPPLDTAGRFDTSLVSVGAHQAHLRGSAVRGPLACSECHRVPQAVDDPGHLDGAVQLSFGPLARSGGLAPSWDPSSASCSAVYCHGATLAGGAAAKPVWTRVDGSQAQCGSCHGAPPPAPHPQAPDCARCHPGTVLPDGSIDVAGGQHIDGAVQLASACNACHGSAANAAPPRDLAGTQATDSRGVGAHQAHLVDGPLRKAVGCAACHRVPAAVGDPGHLGSGRAQLAFGPLASAGGVSAAWDPQALTCTVWCHGAALAGGAAAQPLWTRVDGVQVQCGGCHGAPPPAPHPQRAACARCHPGTVRADGSIDVEGGLHVDGVVQAVPIDCTGCHGTPGQNPAPPRDLAGRTSAAEVTVGAHQAHLQGAGWHRAVLCADCHRVPQKVDDPGHLDHALPAVLAFGAVAAAGGAVPTWDRSAATCTGVACHGAGLREGTNTAPRWTAGAAQAACGTCHAAPPANHYGDQCSWCHPTMAGGVGDGFAQPARHVDGVLDVAFGPCGSCHAVPPASGAHRVHVGEPDATRAALGLDYGDARATEQYEGASGDRYLFGCGNCHPLDPSRHVDGRLQVELSPAGAPAGSLRARNLETAAWDPVSRTCSGVWCHSSGQADTFDGQSPPQRLTPAFAATPSWDTGHTGCTSCHLNPPRYPSGGAGAPTANGHLQYSAESGWDEGHFRGVAHDWHGDPSGGASAVTCQTCHFATVDPGNSAAANPSRDPSRPLASGFYYLDTTGDYVVGAIGNTQWRCAACHTGRPGEPAAGTGRVRPLRHVNGARDVVFDDRQAVVDYPFVPGQKNPVRPQWQAPLGTDCEGHTPEVCAIWLQRSVVDGATWSFSLSNRFTDAAHPAPAPSYDPATKTCWYVGCHLGNPSPVWGAPMGTWSGCTTCHAK